MEEETAARTSGRREEIRRRGADFLSQAIETGKGVYELAQGELAEVFTDLASRREQFEKESVAFVGKLLRQQQTDIREIEKKALAVINGFISKLNKSILTRFSLLDKAVSRVDARLKQIEARFQTPQGVAQGDAPLNGYDRMNVKMILAKLRELSREELQKLRVYELATKARARVLEAVERRMKRQAQ